ncbi:hypothetical protein EJ08DRAFT_231503 [Tothia fuscella]|uniref:Uncharacterized protein n=1 Tax=Tothia fuscella TaxID=1048955 RepID=A0A9P4U4M9_9PEZI|nr:hypothetical protein EJ08DRAFT_231503 [Tothia fuscella]
MTFRASQHPTRFPLQTVAAIPNNGPYQGTSAYDPSAGLNSERGCRVYVRDDVVAPTAQQPQGSVVMDETSQCFAIDKNSTSELERLRNALNARDISRTRWINIVGFSASASKVVTQKFLGDHDCLELNDLDIQTIGGPTRGSADSDFFWVQSQIWTAGNRERLWNSLRATSLRVIVCLPKEKEAGMLWGLTS